MKRAGVAADKTPSITQYAAISVIGFIVSLGVIYYYLQYIQGKVSEQADQKIFYLILIVFGISASALIFGVMNSYGVLKGEKLNTTFKFTGPIVGVVLTVLGGFFLPHSPAAKMITIRVFDDKNTPVAHGEVKLYLPGYIRGQSIDNNGQAQFSEIPENSMLNKIRIDVISPGYANLTLDTTLQQSSAIQVTLSKTRLVQIEGRVKDAREFPIKNVEINVDGTKYYATSITDGSYSLQLTGYSVGDEITLTTSNRMYEDKTFDLRIESPEMKHIDFVLNPITIQPTKPGK